MRVLGIETSCDDTCAAVVIDGRQIISNVISSQLDVHQDFGGVVPEIAARQHLEQVTFVIKVALDQAGLGPREIDAVAVTHTPGLANSLLVGVSAAKGLAYALRIPLIGINHLEGHLYSVYLEHERPPGPHICLAVSGGHTLLFWVDGFSYKILGRTIDDAAGEAFDKVARWLGLGFPGGPAIDRLARQAGGQAVEFPSPLLRSGDANFSFSGLKTAVRYFVEKMDPTELQQRLPAIAAGFQNAVVLVLTRKTMEAARSYCLRTITVTGGVAANSQLRQQLQREAEAEGITVLYPSARLCTDNAAMIAGLAYHKLQQGQRSDWRLDVIPTNALLDSMA